MLPQASLSWAQHSVTKNLLPNQYRLFSLHLKMGAATHFCWLARMPVSWIPIDLFHRTSAAVHVHSVHKQLTLKFETKNRPKSPKTLGAHTKHQSATQCRPRNIKSSYCFFQRHSASDCVQSIFHLCGAVVASIRFPLVMSYHHQPDPYKMTKTTV